MHAVAMENCGNDYLRCGSTNECEVTDRKAQKGFSGVSNLIPFSRFRFHDDCLPCVPAGLPPELNFVRAMLQAMSRQRVRSLQGSLHSQQVEACSLVLCSRRAQNAGGSGGVVRSSSLSC